MHTRVIIHTIMEGKKDLTKELLADCFKGILATVPFDKITIKMITDRAGLIRPTFYKHFQDKYEVIEWIFKNEVISQADPIFDKGDSRAGILLLARLLDEDRDFYRRLLRAEHNPNSFSALLRRYIQASILKQASRRPASAGKALLSAETVALFYTDALAGVLISWLNREVSGTPEELSEMLLILLEHTALELVTGESPMDDTPASSGKKRPIK